MKHFEVQRVSLLTQLQRPKFPLARIRRVRVSGVNTTEVEAVVLLGHEPGWNDRRPGSALDPLDVSSGEHISDFQPSELDTKCVAESCLAGDKLSP